MFQPWTSLRFMEWWTLSVSKGWHVFFTTISIAGDTIMIFFQESRTPEDHDSQLAAVLTVIRSWTLIRGYVLCVFKVYSSLSRFIQRCKLTLDINTAATHWERRSRTSVRQGLFCVSHRTASTGGFNTRGTLYHLLKLLVNQASTASER